MWKVVQRNQVTLISGGTGSGKSTQFVQVVLEEAETKGVPVYIYMSQPRRIAATTVARRIAQERGENFPGTIGYKIKDDTSVTDDTIVKVVTAEIITLAFQSDPLIANATMVILDEIHEFDDKTDTCLLLLREVLHKRNDLKIVLMTATMDAAEKLFNDYFKDFSIGRYKLQSQIFGVETLYLETMLFSLHREIPEYSSAKLSDEQKSTYNYCIEYFKRSNDSVSNKMNQIQNHLKMSDCENIRGSSVEEFCHAIYEAIKPDEPLDYQLIADVCQYLINEDQDFFDSKDGGTVLVFLPGIYDIQRVYSLLHQVKRWKVTVSIKKLNSNMDTAEQNDILYSKKKQNNIRIILATKCAEASITIEDVVIVVDPGFAKTKVYNHLIRTSELIVSECSQDSAEQRKGRAGRVQKGLCCRLYFEFKLRERPYSTTPAMQREEAYGFVLKCITFKSSNESLTDYAAKAPNAPNTNTIAYCLKYLNDIGAIEYTHGGAVITELGEIVKNAGMDIKLVIFLLSSIPFKCLSTISTIVAFFQLRFLFYGKLKQKDDDNIREEQEKLGAKLPSDVLFVLKLFDLYTNAKTAAEKEEICKKYGAREDSLKEMIKFRETVPKLLRKFKLVHADCNTVTDERYNYYSNNWGMVQACLVMGSYPSFGVARSTADGDNIATETMKTARIDKSSVMHSEKEQAHLEWKYIIYQEMVKKHNNVFLRGVTVTTQIHMLLFASATTVQIYEVLKQCLNQQRSNPLTFKWETMDNMFTLIGSKEQIECICKMKVLISKYFSNWLQYPLHYPKAADNDLLATIDTVLQNEMQAIGLQNDIKKLIEVSNFEPCDETVAITNGTPQEQLQAHAAVITPNENLITGNVANTIRQLEPLHQAEEVVVVIPNAEIEPIQHQPRNDHANEDVQIAVPSDSDSDSDGGNWRAQYQQLSAKYNNRCRGVG